MANRWRNKEKSERLYFLGSKITTDGDRSHEIKRHLLLGRKVMTNLESILKSRDITLPTKVCLVKAMVFPVVMYGCDSWTIKKAEHWRIDAFEPWCWRRLLRVPWTARSSNQSIIKEISPEYSLEGLMLKLKLQSFGHLMRKADSFERPWCWERLKTRGKGDDRGLDGWIASLTQWTWVWVNSGSWWWTGRPGVLQFMGSQRVGHEWLNWTELRLHFHFPFLLPSCWPSSQARACPWEQVACCVASCWVKHVVYTLVASHFTLETVITRSWTVESDHSLGAANLSGVLHTKLVIACTHDWLQIGQDIDCLSSLADQAGYGREGPPVQFYQQLSFLCNVKHMVTLYIHHDVKSFAIW